MKKYLILNAWDDPVGHVLIPEETAQAIADNWEYLSIEPSVLRSMTVAGDTEDQLISFSMVVHPAVEADRD